jgi:spermidine/putrescine transport system permease protein
MRWIAVPYIVWMVLFTVVPIFLIVWYAITGAPGGGLTLAHLIRFGDWVYVKVLLRSLGMAILCTAICLVLGYPVALILSRRPSGGMLAVLFILPMWMNFLLRTYAWMSLLENTGLINRFLELIGLERVQFLYNPGAVLLGMTYNFLPFMILPIYTVLQKIDPSLPEAARDLGANEYGVFLKVILPLSAPGILSGIVMVFMPAVTTFVISRLLGGGQYMMFGDLIQNQFLFVGDWHFGSALSLIMMALILLSMAIMNRFSQDAEGRPLL